MTFKPASDGLCTAALRDSRSETREALREVTLHSTLSCGATLCSERSAWKEKDACIATKYTFKTASLFGLPLEKPRFMNHYSMLIYIYIFIYFFSPPTTPPPPKKTPTRITKEFA